MTSAEQVVKDLAFPEDKKAYIVNVLDPVLEDIVQEVLNKMPPDPVKHMVTYLHQKSGIVTEAAASQMEENKKLKKELAGMVQFVSEAGASVHQEEDSDAETSGEELDDMPPPPVSMGARKSVSAEAYGQFNKKKEFIAPEYPKSPEQKERLKKVLGSSFMFMNCAKKEFDTLVLAMQEQVFQAGQRIIQQGDDGDCLYVIEEGSPTCSIKKDGKEQVVKTCQPGDVFGELALLYNAPRAASVDAVDRCVAWKLDRETFNYIVKDASAKRFDHYAHLLDKVTILSSLDQYDRVQLSDAFKEVNLKKDESVVTQGDKGDRFFIVEEGTLVALKDDKQVLDYGVGDYFGELALLKNQPRAATVKVTSDTAKVVSLERKAFNKLLGPLTEVLQKKASASYA